MTRQTRSVQSLQLVHLPATAASVSIQMTGNRFTTSLYITLPVMGDFLNTPDSAGVYEFDEARRSADILLMKADFNKEKYRIDCYIGYSDYMS